MRRLTSSILLAIALVLPLLAAPAQAAPARRIDYTAWDTPAELRSGTLESLRVAVSCRRKLTGSV